MAVHKRFQTTLYQKFITFIGICLVLLGIYSLGLRFYYAPSTATDLLEDYNAARTWAIGRQIYTNPNNNHPPLLIMLVLPLSFLKYGTAIQVWNFLSLLVMAWLVILLKRHLAIPINHTVGILITGVLLIWFPLHTLIAEGQVTIFLVMCLVGAWVKLRQNRDITAGVLLGIAVHIKLFPFLFVLYLLFRRKYKALIAMLATILLLGIGLLLVFGVQNIWRYLSTVLMQSSLNWSIFPTNSSLNGLLGRLFLPGPWVQPLMNSPAIYLTLYILTVMAILLGFSIDLLKLPRTHQGDNLSFGITCIIMLLLSPMTWSHSVILLFIPYSVIVFYSLANSNQQRLLLLITFVMVSIPDITLARALMAYNAPNQMHWHHALLFALPTLSFILLWLMLRYNWKYGWGQE